MGKLIILTDTSLTFGEASEKLEKLGLLDDDGNIIESCTMFSGRMRKTSLAKIVEMLNYGKTVVLHDVSDSIEMVN